MKEKMYKSNKDRKICGVCGGIAEYIGMDSTVVRILTAILICCWGSGLLAYILAALIMDENPEYVK